MISVFPYCLFFRVYSSSWALSALRKSVHFFILLLLGFTILYLIVGVMGYNWYIMEIATLFFAMGIFAGIAMKKSADEIVKLFLEGVKDILPAALIVGLAGGIIIILEDGQVVDTILYKFSEGIKGSGKIATVGFMYLIQNCINLILVSGSAKAALTMPIFAPFSDLVGSFETGNRDGLSVRGRIHQYDNTSLCGSDGCFGRCPDPLRKMV